jgi:hypothetical protein
MNIVEVIKSQLTNEAIHKLSSLLGIGEDTVRSSVGAAVPGLLSLMSNLVSSSTGADRLINSLKQVDPGAHGNFGDVLSSQPTEVQAKGGNVLEILFGSSALPAIFGVLSKFAGIAAPAMKGLLGYLAPMILASIGRELSGKHLTSQLLSSFFAEQKSNISSALPRGLSLADIPGFTGASASRAASTPAAAETPGLPSWLLPLAALAVLAALAWWFFGRPAEEPAGPGPGAPVVVSKERSGVDTNRPPTAARETKGLSDALPDSTKLGGDLGAIYTSLTDLLTGIKDVPSAEAALPKLTDLGPKVEAMKALWDKLGDTGKSTVAKVTTDHLTKLKELVSKILALPGVSEKLKPVVDGLVTKLAAFAVA